MNYPQIGEMVWVRLTIQDWSDEKELQDLLEAYDGYNALGYVVRYMTDDSEEGESQVWASIHILECETIPIEHDIFHRYISSDRCTIDRPIDEYSISWIAKNSEDCPFL
jgi:hypothetical protein